MIKIIHFYADWCQDCEIQNNILEQMAMEYDDISIELVNVDYQDAKAKKYGFVQLNSRYQDIKLPEIELVDILRAKKRKEMRSHFSPALIDNIKESLNLGEQVILFQNRRGFAPYLECDMCGWIPHCTNCDVSLTYHRHNNELVCHYCGHTIRDDAVDKSNNNISWS